MQNDFTSIPKRELPTMIGKLVHVAGWNRGCCFRLIAYDGDTAWLRTPKTKRSYLVDVTKLQYTRLNAPDVLEVKP